MRLPGSVALPCTVLVFDLPARSAGRADERVRAPTIRVLEQPTLLIRSDDGGMSRIRQGELDAPLSRRFRDALRDRNIQLLTYRDLMRSCESHHGGLPWRTGC